MSRRLVVASGVLALTVVAILIAVLIRSRPAPNVNPTPSPTTTVKPAQATMIVGVRNDAKQLVDGVVMAAQSVPPMGSWLSLQPGLAVDISPGGVVTLQDTGVGGADKIAAAVGNEVGLRVDGGFIMDRLAFAAMVDTVGGVTVEVKAPLIKMVDGKPKVVVKSGVRRLDGPTAATYVITLSPGEAQSSRMDRFDQVWRQVIVQLPGNPDRVRSIVGSLGSLSRISLSPDAIAAILLDYQTAVADQQTHQAKLPAHGQGVGATAIFTLAPTRTLALVTSMFTSALLVPGTNGVRPRVRLIAATTSEQAVVATKSDVESSGFSSVWGGTGAHRNETKIVVPDEAAAAEIGRTLAQALGLTSDAVTVGKTQTAGVQAAVFVGADLNPNAMPTPKSSS